MNTPEHQTITLNQKNSAYLSVLLSRYRTEIVAEQIAFRTRYGEVLHNSLDEIGLVEQRALECKMMVIMLLHTLLKEGTVTKDILDSADQADEAFAIVQDFNDAGDKEASTDFAPVERTITLNTASRKKLEQKLDEYTQRIARLRAEYKQRFPAGHNVLKLTKDELENKDVLEEAIEIAEKRIQLLEPLLRDGTVTTTIQNSLEMFKVFKIIEDYNSTGGQNLTRDIPAKRWWNYLNVLKFWQ
jgi:hypothetical protein